MIINAKPSGVLSLGREGENQARSIRFDISHWVKDFGPGVVELVHQRSGDPYPYPVVVTQTGNEVLWNITATDTAMVGLGRCELRYYVGETLAKSETWMTKVFPALGPAAETPPDPYQSWVDQVLQAGAAAAEAADRAEEAAVRQPYPNAETGTWWVWDAESGAYTDTGISYGTGGGTSDHDKLLGRDKENQHPMSAITGLVDALAGKQPTGNYLTKETDPTVPAWAKAETKPAYTAPEVGADPAGTAAVRVSEHNTEATAHSDMRLLIQGLTDRLNSLADSDDTTLDQLSEIVAYIKSNRNLIAAVTTDKVSVGDIVNDLVTNVANKPLSAAQGVALKALIDSLNASDIGAIPVPVTATVGQTIRVSAVDENGQPTEWEAVDMASGGNTEDAPIYLGTVPVSADTAYYLVIPVKDYKKVVFMKERAGYDSGLKANLHFGVYNNIGSNNPTIGYTSAPGYTYVMATIECMEDYVVGDVSYSNNHLSSPMYNGALPHSSVFNKLGSGMPVNMDNSYYGFYTVDPSLAFDGNETVHVWGWKR